MNSNEFKCYTKFKKKNSKGSYEGIKLTYYCSKGFRTRGWTRGIAI